MLSLTHSLTHSHTQHKISHLTFTHTTQDLTTHSLHSLTPLTHSSSLRSVQRLQKGARGRRWGPALSAVSGAVFRDCRRASGARGRRWGPGSLRSVQRLQKGLRRAWSPLGVRLSPQWPAQGPETAEGPAARVVAAGGPALSAVSGAVFRDCRRASGARGRRWGPGSLRSVERLQKGLRRAWSLLGVRLSPQWPAAGAGSRDCRRACGARGRRWARLSPQCPAQCSETAEGPPARVVAAGGPALSAVSRDCRRASGARGRRWGSGSLRSGRRRVQRLQGRACGARGRRWGPGSLAQCSETAEGAAARVVAAGGRLSPQCPAQCSETAEGAAARAVAAGGPALSAVSCPETAEVPAARVVAAGGPALFRDCRRASGARGRRWGPGFLRSPRRPKPAPRTLSSTDDNLSSKNLSFGPDAVVCVACMGCITMW